MLLQMGQKIALLMAQALLLLVNIAIVEVPIYNKFCIRAEEGDVEGWTGEASPIFLRRIRYLNR